MQTPLPTSPRRWLAALALAALGAAGVNAHAATDLHIGISNRSLLGLPILVAKEKGFFEKEGLNVSIDYFAGGVPATAALIGGSVQFIDAALENNVKAVKRGQPIVSVANLQTDFAGAVIVRKDVSDKLGRTPTVQDLKGLRIGTLARGGFADVSTRYIVADAGLDAEKDIAIVPVRGADRQLTAGEAGEIDAAFVMEPWNVIAVDVTRKWDYVLDLTQGKGPAVFQGLGYTTLQTTRDYVKNNRETTDKVVRAVIAALQYIVDPANLDDLAAIANEEYGKPGLDVLKLSLRRQAHTFSPHLSEAALEKTGHLLLASDAIKAPVPGYADVADTSFKPLWDSFRPLPASR
ncbi:ABC transporter substrate-binding protein [plant metagenome]|uniref:ABC transporter substrate-binding protein n=1 Tax=plant metagenome TaxID=1297885 RepID=A0A484S7H0_9ZZZZ